MIKKFLALCLVSTALLLGGVAFSDVTGWRTPGTTTDAGSGSPSGSTEPWANPNNAQTDDSSWTTQDTDTSSDQGNYILTTNYGFAAESITAGSIIDGIEWRYIRRTESNSQDTLENSVKLIQGGSVAGNELADGVTTWVEEPSEETFTAGGASELGGLTWTVTDIESSGFGVAISSVSSGAINKLAEIDVVEMRVHFTPPGAGPTAPIPGTRALMGVGR